MRSGLAPGYARRGKGNMSNIQITAYIKPIPVTSTNTEPALHVLNIVATGPEVFLEQLRVAMLAAADNVNFKKA